MKRHVVNQCRTPYDCELCDLAQGTVNFPTQTDVCVRHTYENLVKLELVIGLVISNKENRV